MQTPWIHAKVRAHKSQECFLTCGSFGDVEALQYYTFDVPAGAIMYADKASNDYEIEDLLKEIDHIQLLPMRKKNSKRASPHSLYKEPKSLISGGGCSESRVERHFR
jgi:hypothetical protein